MKILLFANTDWYLYNFRLALAKAIRRTGVEVVLVSPPGDYGERLRSEGFRWVPVPMDRRSLNPWAEVMLVRKLTGLYRSERPDLVHHFTIKPVVYGSLAARLAGVPCRVNAVAGLGHVFISPGMRARLLRPVVRLLMRMALRASQGRLILQNRDDLELFLENRLVDPGSIRVIRSSGVNTEKYRPRDRRENADGRVRVLLATRLLWDKGIGEYIAAARLLKQRSGNIEFLVAGAPDEGNPASVPYAFLDRWSRQGVITALGHVDDMPEVLRQVDIVVLPSYREGVPRILVEAACCGLPLVATAVPGCREIVEHKVNGLLVREKDSNDLAQAIRYLADHPAERSRMGMAGRKKAVEEFDEKIVIQRTMSVYRELVRMPDNGSQPERTVVKASDAAFSGDKALSRRA